MILAAISAWAARFHDEPAYALAEFQARYAPGGAEFSVAWYPHSGGRAYAALVEKPTASIPWRQAEPVEASA